MEEVLFHIQVSSRFTRLTVRFHEFLRFFYYYFGGCVSKNLSGWLEDEIRKCRLT
jgi:hypothetical protein